MKKKKDTGVGCHFLLQDSKIEAESISVQRNYVFSDIGLYLQIYSNNHVCMTHSFTLTVYMLYTHVCDIYIYNL